MRSRQSGPIVAKFTVNQHWARLSSELMRIVQWSPREQLVFMTGAGPQFVSIERIQLKTKCCGDNAKLEPHSNHMLRRFGETFVQLLLRFSKVFNCSNLFLMLEQIISTLTGGDLPFRFLVRDCHLSRFFASIDEVIWCRNVPASGMSRYTSRIQMQRFE